MSPLHRMLGVVIRCDLTDLGSLADVLAAGHIDARSITKYLLNALKHSTCIFARIVACTMAQSIFRDFARLTQRQFV